MRPSKNFIFGTSLNWKHYKALVVMKLNSTDKGSKLKLIIKWCSLIVEISNWLFHAFNLLHTEKSNFKDEHSEYLYSTLLPDNFLKTMFWWISKYIYI